jgi:hypothetical protein
MNIVLAVVTGLTLALAAPRTQAGEQPDPAMLAAAERVANFIETGDASLPGRSFADGDVTILENMPPHLFVGPNAVATWSKAMREHLQGVTGLRHMFGRAQDFRRTGDEVFFSLPTTWRGVDHGTAFVEHGGWAFLLRRQGGAWRVRSYGWAVTQSSEG